MVRVEFTADEARALIALLDVATKAGGLQVAQQALPLAVKIQQAIEADKPSEQG